MHHHVAHARGLAFRDWREGRALWDRIAQRLPGTRAVVLMPDHVHVLATSADPRPFDDGLRAYALWRNRSRGEHGPVWQPHPPVETLANATHHRRSVRYLHLNPCRAGLADCPAAWPLSTHRELLGLAGTAIRERDRDPVAFHAYVSGDPSVHVQGSEYPGGRLCTDRPDLDALAAAVSEWARAPLSSLRQRGRARRTFIGAARALTSWPHAEIAAWARVHKAQISRTPPLSQKAAAAIARMIGDPRFPGLVHRDPRIRLTRGVGARTRW